MSTSKKVGSGIPNLAGSNLCNSINSFFHIFCANFRGMGGDEGPTAIASVVVLLVGPGKKSDNGVRGVRAIRALELPLVLTDVFGAVKVVTPDNAVLCGMQPRLGVVAGFVGDPVAAASVVLIDMHYVSTSVPAAHRTGLPESLPLLSPSRWYCLDRRSRSVFRRPRALRSS